MLVHLVLGALVVVLAGTLAVLLRRAARLRADAESAADRVARLRGRVEHASVALTRSLVTPPSESGPERRPRERRRSRRSQSPSAQP